MTLFTVEFFIAFIHGANLHQLFTATYSKIQRKGLKNEKYKEIVKKRENEDYTMNIRSSIFTNIAVAVLSTQTFIAFLRRAEGSFAFNDIRKVVP